MDSKIDYLSFTVLEDCRTMGEGEALDNAVIATLWKSHPQFCQMCELLTGWQPCGARGHYGEGMFNPLYFITIRYGGHSNHILVEMPGTACQAAREMGVLETIIDSARDRLTRIDIAVDIQAGCSPADFVAAGYTERFTAHASIVSAEGTTEYVGSMKSERFARVYMYAPPHPRAGTLRVEHVLRGDYAKAAASEACTGGAMLLATMCGNTWGWKSDNWQPAHITDGKLRSTRADRHEPGRVRWLYQVVIPAIRRAANEGLIDLPDYLARI
jgi:hypothetical protein